MKKVLRHMVGKMLMATVALSFSWSCINEDLSDCGKEYKILYDVNLVTNLETELETELETVEEKELARRLKEALKNVFTDQAHDVDLRFYTNDSLLNYEEQHIIDGNNASYTIYLPVRDYQHLALANDDTEPNVTVRGLDYCPSLAWEQVKQDTIDSYGIGLFSARLNMEVKDVDQVFQVKLYMQNAAVALVIHPNNVAVDYISGVLTHLADGFQVRDSVYCYHDQTVVRATKMEDTGTELQCFYAVGFPSRDVPFKTGKTVNTEASEGSIWEFKAYVALPNGKITETTLHVKEPLKAGNLKIINATLMPDGSLVVGDAPEIGASVELDWKEGGSFNPEI